MGWPGIGSEASAVASANLLTSFVQDLHALNDHLGSPLAAAP